MKSHEPAEAEAQFPPTAHCPYFQELVELIGKRWTGAILRTLFAGCSRFGEIADTVPGLSNRLLSERLTRLQEAGLVIAREGPRPYYSLTERGRDLRRVLAEFEAWNQRWGQVERART